MTQVIDTPHGCFKIHGPSNYAWIKRQLLDARRYQFLRDAPVYDTGLAVAIFNCESDPGAIIYDDLDAIIDREMEIYRKNREANAVI